MDYTQILLTTITLGCKGLSATHTPAYLVKKERKSLMTLTPGAG